MLLVSQGPGGALSARRCTRISPLQFTHKNPPLFSNITGPKFISKRPPFYPNLAKVDGGVDSTSATKQPLSNNNSAPPPPPFSRDDPVFVGPDNVPLEGVIQFEKPTSSSRLDKWGLVFGRLLPWGYGEDGRGMNGVSKAVIAALKSWALGIPDLDLIELSPIGIRKYVIKRFLICY
ncbi:hypothetical protein GH714_004171 [Hevea brasiliensis]|uniref:Uncharacterized protein n=1 Tax=Hevea brasiliensis TaxID=3981 RepID=A0A6A6NFQ9_HEVBR|nr:hypothetical protein GH714_004171 [Hevea brasiliensis]